jgi:hypothetical protein
LLGDGFAGFPPAATVGSILIEEFAKGIAAASGEMSLVKGLKMLVGVDAAEVWMFARRLGVEIDLLAANPFEVVEAAIEVQAGHHDVVDVGDESGAIVRSA